jgi:hypothetical protein
MGQQDIKELKKQRYAKKHQHSFTALEKKMSRSPEHASRHLSRQFRAIQKTTLKADKATNQTMDSILWEFYDTNYSVWWLTEKEFFTYDGNGNMINYVWFVYDSVENKFLPVDRATVKHNAQGQPTEIIWMEWESGQWVNIAKFELTYDGEGNLIQETVSEWDPDSSQWQFGLRYDMTYDVSGNILSELWSYWDEESSKFDETFKDEYIYEGGKLTTWNEYMWDVEAWELTYFTAYTYDNGNLILELTQARDYLTEDWGDYSKIAYTYVGDRVVTEEVWGFDLMSFTMVRQSYFEYTWDADGNLITEVESSWDEEAGAVKSWNDAASWVNTWKSEWAFNKNFSIKDLYVPYWFMADVTDLTFVHMPVSETGYFNNNGTWDLNYRQTAYYSDFGGGGPSGIKDVQKAAVSVFPNHASEIITFSWGDEYSRLNLEIYDLTGKQIISRSIENNEVIRVEDLSRGLYLYKLSNNKHLIDARKINLR